MDSKRFWSLVGTTSKGTETFEFPTDDGGTASLTAKGVASKDATPESVAFAFGLAPKVKTAASVPMPGESTLRREDVTTGGAASAAIAEFFGLVPARPAKTDKTAKPTTAATPAAHS